MDRLEIGIISVVVSLVLLAIRVPIGLTLISVSFVGIGAVASWKAAWGVLSSIPYSFAASWELSAVPMFLLMGYIAARGQLTSGLFGAMRVLFNWMPGSLAVASVSASALFASASGSSVATSAALSRIAVPEMLRANYSKSLATGTIAAAGTLGALIPPSILMVVYGVFTNTAIGPLFIAGIIPGLLTAGAFILMIIVRVMIDPRLAPRHTEAISARDRRAAFMGAWPLPVMVLAVLGTIMAGIATPTEAGALGAAMAILLAA
ncbi:TRAP transporter large permease subunit, partial [Ruixingdingia sedimenti]